MRSIFSLRERAARVLQIRLRLFLCLRSRPDLVYRTADPRLKREDTVAAGGFNRENIVAGEGISLGQMGPTGDDRLGMDRNE